MKVTEDDYRKLQAIHSALTHAKGITRTEHLREWAEQMMERLQTALREDA